MSLQEVILAKNYCHELEKIFKERKAKNVLLVCGKSFFKLPISDILQFDFVKFFIFSDFTVNPKYEEVCAGIEMFTSNECDTIVAVGGGSALDVAKCIKLFAGLDSKINYLQQGYVASKIPLIAVPTTAGTGSESTRFAVIYYKGEKQSVHHDTIIPQYAFLIPTLLESLPDYQKKCTLLDALCQAIESYWSVNSTGESKLYAQKAITLILDNLSSYLSLKCDETTLESIMVASNYAGRAINITQTTAPHAMSYKMTTGYGISHGHAVAIALPVVWKYMNENIDLCSDARGPNYLKKTFEEIATLFGEDSVIKAIEKFNRLLNEMGIVSPKVKDNAEPHLLAESVNVERLANNPVELNREICEMLYKQILS